MRDKPGTIGFRVALLSLTLILAATNLAWPANPLVETPQPNGAALKDGLAVRYYFAKFNHVRELETWMKFKDGKDGPPVSMLDSKVGKGNVLTSDVQDLVGAHMTGYIRFDVAGDYQFLVTSNDGIRITLGGVKIYEDPDVHPDRTSDPIPVQVDEAGWHALEILYFEKKNTSTIQMHWRPPGAPGFVPVPAEAFKH